MECLNYYFATTRFNHDFTHLGDRRQTSAKDNSNLVFTVNPKHMKSRLFALCIAGFFTAQAAHAAELFVNEKPREFLLADKLETNATIGGYPIWNGEGKWRLIELTKSESSGGAAPIPLGAAGFFQTEGKQFVAAMQVRANLRTGNGFWIDEPCKREDMLFKLQLAGGREDNCVTINHITRYMSNPGGKLLEVYALFKEQGIEIPPTVLNIVLTRNATSQRKLVFSIWINPELAGFARETEPEWGRNPWNKAQSLSDPKKKQYIDALSQWATNFAKKMNDGLNQKPDAFADVPSWRSLHTSTPQPEIFKPQVTLD